MASAMRTITTNPATTAAASGSPHWKFPHDCEPCHVFCDQPQSYSAHPPESDTIASAQKPAAERWKRPMTGLLPPGTKQGLPTRVLVADDEAAKPAEDRAGRGA